mmetsp:Transcript_25649/g.42814  ORF Transcript_25649/g.42814 Transcript_25649/m.42814 type:complete len:217 (-) Transcript_25649:263-913(-)
MDMKRRPTALSPLLRRIWSWTATRSTPTRTPHSACVPAPLGTTACPPPPRPSCPPAPPLPPPSAPPAASSGSWATPPGPVTRPAPRRMYRVSAMKMSCRLPTAGRTTRRWWKKRTSWARPSEVFCGPTTQMPSAPTGSKRDPPPMPLPTSRGTRGPLPISVKTGCASTPPMQSRSTPTARWSTVRPPSSRASSDSAPAICPTARSGRTHTLQRAAS